MSAITTAIDVKELYRATAREASIVEVPTMQFLMVDGTKNPNQPGAFQDAVQALYSLSYGAKFVLKKEGIEFKVSPLEGLWGLAGGLNPNQKTSWQWRQVCT